MNKVLHKPFNIEDHKREFTNYLEVVIAPNGVVEYAVPSHTRKLTQVACDKLGVTEEELNKLVPEEYYCDMMLWLCRVTGYLAVWNEFFEGEPNRNQYQMLSRLKSEGLYRGGVYRYGYGIVNDYSEIKLYMNKKVEVLTNYPNKTRRGKLIVRFLLVNCDIHIDNRQTVVVSGLTEYHVRGLYDGAILNK